MMNRKCGPKKTIGQLGALQLGPLGFKGWRRRTYLAS